jgi:hypothetical protein
MVFTGFTIKNSVMLQKRELSKKLVKFTKVNHWILLIQGVE